MAKKMKRRQVSRNAVSYKPAASTAAHIATGTPASTAPAQPVNLNEEYHYVLSDLRRMGLLALGMVGLLFVLGILAQYVIH
jgi:hypothetical protein